MWDRTAERRCVGILMLGESTGEKQFIAEGRNDNDDDRGDEEELDIGNGVGPG